MASPIGYQENEGDYFGLSRTPDIDEVIDIENARTGADPYDKFIGAEVKFPNREDLILLTKVKRKIKSVTRMMQVSSIHYEITAYTRSSSVTAQQRK